MSRVSKEDTKKFAAWKVEQKWAPARRLSTPEMQRARQMFHEIDTNQSGAIDFEELGRAMRNLGQNPSDNDLRELVAAVDDGDGQLQMREFFDLFARGLDTNGTTRSSDVTDTFVSMGGDPADDMSKVDAESVRQHLIADFDLDVSLADVFGIKGTGELSRKDFERLLVNSPRT